MTKSGQDEPLKINLQYHDKGKTKEKTLEYGAGAGRKGFYDGVHDLDLSKDIGKSKKKEK